MKIRLTINGGPRARRPAAHAPPRRPARPPRPHRHQRGLRRGRVRLLHRAPRRRAGERLSRPRRPVRRARHPHRRGPGRGRAPLPSATLLHRPRQARNAASARRACCSPQRPCCASARAPASRRSARPWPATSVAARATSASSRACSRRRPPPRGGAVVSLVDLPLFEMQRPATLASLCATLGRAPRRRKIHGALLAGGTDWMVEQEMRPPLAPGEEPPLVMDIGRLAELRGVRLSWATPCASAPRRPTWRSSARPRCAVRAAARANGP
jgi:hypothetical protein